ncbi:MAG TPA: TolC family protein [Gemmatimonadaceae bacterium]
MTVPAHVALDLRALVGIGACVAIAACAPAMPRLDGAPGAPPAPSSLWPVPSAARTPLPAAAPPAASAASRALTSDSATAAAGQMLSLVDVMDVALRNNPQTRQSWALARASVNDYGSSRGALYPTVNATVDFTQSNNALGTITGTQFTPGQLDTAGSLASRSGIGASRRSQIAPIVSLSYLIWDLGSRRGAIESAKQTAIAANLTHNVTVQNVVLQVESTLFSFLTTRALRDAQIVAVQEAQADTAASEERFRVGVATLEEVLQTRTALAQARFQLASLEGSVLAARGNLAAAMGLPANARFDVPNIDAREQICAVAASVDTLINRAIALRPEISQARAQAASLAAQVRVARAAGYPALTLTSSASYTTSNAVNASGRNLVLVFGVQIPVFNGFSRQYDVRSAREQYNAGLAQVSSTEQQVTVQVFASYAELQAATQKISAAEELLRSAQQSSDVAVGRYREGVGTIVDVLLGRSALATARADEIQARWEWHTALAQLAHDVGTIDVAGRPNLPLASGADARR